MFSVTDSKCQLRITYQVAHDTLNAEIQRRIYEECFSSELLLHTTYSHNIIIAYKQMH